jgi:hypothetical protein
MSRSKPTAFASAARREDRAVLQGRILSPFTSADIRPLFLSAFLIADPAASSHLHGIAICAMIGKFRAPSLLAAHRLRASRNHIEPGYLFG